MRLKTQVYPYDSVSLKDFFDFVDFLKNKDINFGKIIMDNATIHKKTNREIYKCNGVELIYLPPSSPKKYLFEEVFSKWKYFIFRGKTENYF